MDRPARAIGAVLLLAGSALLGVTLGVRSQAESDPTREQQAAAVKNPATVRAQRRAYDGAPPVIPHEDFQIECTACHNPEGMAVDDVGFAPANPHGETTGLSDAARCRQCHVFRLTEETFRISSFVGLRQDLRHGARLHPLAPPTIPHRVAMRENCAACHAGPGAREEIRTSHPERTRCRQCHVEVTTRGSFPPRSD